MCSSHHPPLHASLWQILQLVSILDTDNNNCRNKTIFFSFPLNNSSNVLLGKSCMHCVALYTTALLHLIHVLDQAREAVWFTTQLQVPKLCCYEYTHMHCQEKENTVMLIMPVHTIWIVQDLTYRQGFSTAALTNLLRS